MPKLSTSLRVKTRIRILLKKLLECVNPSLDEVRPTDFFDYRWLDTSTACPKLVIKTKLNVLVDLIDSEAEESISKAHVREVLLVLQKKLHLLEDNRIKTQGSDVWDFTLKLWHTSTDRNLSKFEQLWTQYKAEPGTNLTDRGSKSSFSSNYALAPRLIQPEQSEIYPLHNLTLRPDGCFIDTQSTLNELLGALTNPDADAIISIVGPGGIGKTTLALEAAHRCLASAQQSKMLEPVTTNKGGLSQRSQISAPAFDVIVFASAQSKEFLGPHLSERWQTDRTLKDIIREILRTVDCAEGAPLKIEAQIEYVYSILKNHKTLLILDNLETVENPNRLLSFVRTLPQTVKVILTSRTRFGVGKTIALDYLATEPGFALITHQARRKKVSLEFSQIREIYRLSGGLPLAMSYSVGYLSVHRQLPVLRSSRLNQTPNEIAQYCVEASLKQLQDESTYHLLAAATLFTEKFSVQAATYVAGLPSTSDTLHQEFSSLYRLSLINKVDDTYYSMHAFTQDFVRSKLEKNLTSKQKTQKRWIAWYVELISPFAENWFDWQNYSELDQEWVNIRAIINWCIEAEEYGSLQKIWQGLQGYTLERGYWDECQEWMSELMRMAEQRKDQKVLAQAMFYKGQTLIRVNETDDEGEALKLLKESWSISPGSDSDTKFGALTYVAAIYIKRHQFENAQDWLNKKNELTNITHEAVERHQCVYYYYMAEISLRKQEYQDAEEFYRKALANAVKSQWEKMSAYTEGGIAAILIKRGELLDEASKLLTSVLKSAKQHQDKRAIAQSYYDLALLAEQRGNLEAFYDWTVLAESEFSKLGMTAAVLETRQWLKNKRSGV
ncbi:MAG: NB-ARC domain-containing protein [Cyanobacteria bacterium J06634_5]